MRKSPLYLLAFSGLLMASPLSASAPFATAAKAEGAKAEIKVGTGVEKHEIVGAADSFSVAPDTKIYAWTKVTGVESGKITFVFSMGDKSSKQELDVPRSPYRTHAYRTFRAGDSGEWTVKVTGPDGADLGSAKFKVEVK